MASRDNAKRRLTILGSTGSIGTQAMDVIRRNPATPVLVKADQSVPYGKVVVGAALLTQSGVAKVGFLTDPVGTEDEDR